jgi:hypothetical protein
MADEAAEDHPGLWYPLAHHLVSRYDQIRFIKNMHDYLPRACPVLMAKRYDDHASKFGLDTKSTWTIICDKPDKPATVCVTTTIVGTEITLATRFNQTVHSG